MPKRPTTHPAVLAEITRLATLGYGGSDIHRMLVVDLGEHGAPGLRTVQEHVKRLAPLDTSGPWSLAVAGDPATAGLVLDTLAAVIEESDGRIHSFTVAEAQWITTIRQVRTDIESTDAWYLARFYVTRQSHGDPTDDLDGYLAFAPWRSDEASKRYVDATLAGQIPSTSLFLYHVLRRDAELLVEEGVSGTIDPTIVWRFAEGPDVFRRRRPKKTGE